MELLKWATDHLQKEWRVIRDAPVAFALFVLITAAILSGIFEWHFSAAEDALEATISSENAENNILREELKGASPQLAAMQARREESRSKLLSFYVDAGPMLALPVAATWASKPPPDDVVKGFLAKEHAWENLTSEWLAKTLGAAAQSRFLDQTTCPSGLGVNQQWFVTDVRYSDALVRLVCLRRNLANLIETGAYDQ